jgi:hypothetical protein
MSSMPVVPQLTASARLVLREVSLQVSDGYTLMAKTGLDRGKFKSAIEELLQLGVIRVEGELTDERIAESFFQVPISVRGRAELLLGGFGEMASSTW